MWLGSWRSGGRIAVVLAAVLTLAACGSDSLSDAMGVQRSGPDATRVAKRPPLIVPPDYTLRPPGGGAAAASRGSALQRAQAALAEPRAISAGTSTEIAVAPASTAAGDSGEQALLARTRATPGAEDPQERTGPQVDRGLLGRLLQQPSDSASGADRVPVLQHRQLTPPSAAEQPS